MDNLFSIRDVADHARLRKNIGHLYTRATVKDFEQHINSCLDLFLHRLAEFTRLGPAKLDMSLWLHYFSFDSLGEINVSKRLGFLQHGQDVSGMIAAADRIFALAGLVSLASSWENTR